MCAQREGGLRSRWVKVRGVCEHAEVRSQKEIASWIACICSACHRMAHPHERRNRKPLCMR